MDNRGKRALGVAAGAAVAAAILHLLGKRGFEPLPPTYICPYCGETFATYEELLAHIQAEHPNDPLPDFGCVIGHVGSAGDGHSIGNAKIYLDDILDTDSSSSGHFSTSYAQYGIHNIRVEADNYQPKTIEIDIQQETTEIEVLLELLPYNPGEWTEGVHVTSIEVTPSHIYLGQEATILFDFECDTYPLPHLHAIVTVNGTTLVEDYENLVHRHAGMKYVPTSVGQFTVTAQSCSVTLVVEEDAPSTYYFPWGGNRIPICKKVAIENVPPYEDSFAFCGGDEEKIVPYNFPGGTLTLGGSAYFMVKHQDFDFYDGRYGQCKISPPYIPEMYMAEHIDEAIPVEWFPNYANVSTWRIYYEKRFPLSSYPDVLDRIMVLPLEHDCPPYWDTKEELVDVIIGFIPRRPPEQAIVDLGDNAWYVFRGVQNKVKPLYRGHNYVRCPYCQKNIIVTGENPSHSDSARKLLKHIEDSHPNHPLTEPAWF